MWPLRWDNSFFCCEAQVRPLKFFLEDPGSWSGSGSPIVVPIPQKWVHFGKLALAGWKMGPDWRCISHWKWRLFQPAMVDELVAMVWIHLDPYIPLKLQLSGPSSTPKIACGAVTTSVTPGMFFFLWRTWTLSTSACHVLKGKILTKLSFLTVHFRFS